MCAAILCEVTPRRSVRDNGQVTATDDMLLPDGTRLVHIGPHKTGTRASPERVPPPAPELRAQRTHHVGFRSLARGSSVGDDRDDTAQWLSSPRSIPARLLAETMAKES